MFKVKKIDNKIVYYSDLLDNWAQHFFTSRQIVVKENIDVISKYLNIKSENLIHPIQTHSDNVEIIQKGKTNYQETDSLITDRNDVAIYLNFADCIPVILYDKNKNIGAIAHCGWRGTVSKIAIKTIMKMQKIYNTNPKDIIAIIGPGIGFKHFETSIETIELLKRSIENQEGLFNNRLADLKRINERQLIEYNVKNIDICPYCTVDDNDKFFSYRKENKTKLRHSALIKLN